MCIIIIVPLISNKPALIIALAWYPGDRQWHQQSLWSTVLHAGLDGTQGDPASIPHLIHDWKDSF